MKADIKRELDLLKAQSANGRITTRMVIERARNKRSALHKHFTWNAQEALRKNLENEARALLREYSVVIVTPAGPVRTRHFVSLATDRTNGGGYRAIADVLDNEELTDRLLEDALAELEAFTSRYRKLEQLAGVFREIERLREQHQQPTKRRRVVQEQRV
jgi:hypothetical protein